MSTACSDGGGSAPESLADLGVSDGASQGLKVEKMVAAGAEASIELDTGAKLLVPSGSTQKALNIGLKRPSDDEALGLVKSMKDEYKLASAPYVLTPHGSTFEKNVEVTLPLAKNRDPEKLKVAWLSDENDKSWELIGTPEVSAGKAKIKVDHFSVFALVEYEASDVPADGLDGGVVQADGGDVQPDTGARLDGGAQADGGPDVSHQQLFYKKFETCGILERAGDYTAPDFGDEADDACEFACIGNASCEDFLLFGCGGSEEFSDALYECVSACHGSPISRTTPDYCGPGEDAELCDGWEDCSDGSDENACPAGTHFVCGDGERVPARSACDGDEDCWDGTDEDNCPAGIHFACTNDQRVPVEARCDGNWDCSDESDEANCPVDHYFYCTNGSRIPKALTCDADADCSDGSDEDNCEGKVFTCTDGSDMLPMDHVCDASRDCADGSDEPARCVKLSCDWLADSEDDTSGAPDAEPDAGTI